MTSQLLPTTVGLGVDVGGTKILACATSPAGEVLAQAEIASPGDTNQLLVAVTDVLFGLISTLDVSRCVLGGLGVAIPGLINPAGVLAAAPNLDAPETELDLRATLLSPLRTALADGGIALASTDVALDNDGTCAALAESVCGAATGFDDAIVVSLGTGIGGGLIANGRLARGVRHYAGEVGHMRVEPDGAPCTCGRKGCWEQYASGHGLARLARERIVAQRPDDPPSSMVRDCGGDLRFLRGEHVIAAANSGDAVALNTLSKFSYWLALGLVSLTEILDPGLIVIGGGLAQTSALWLGETREQIDLLSRPAMLHPTSNIVVAALGSRAAAIGASLMGLAVSSPR